MAHPTCRIDLRLPREVLCCTLGAIVLLCLTVPPSVQAQDAGAGAFARLGFGARGIGLGNALLADPSPDVSTYYNPALATQASEQRLAASAALMSFDRELQFLEFTTPVGPTAGLGFGLIHAGVSGIDGRDRNGNRTEELSTDEFNIFFAFGNRFSERFRVGATLQLYQADYLEQTQAARTFALDLGTIVDVTDNLHVGVVVSDLLAKYEWNSAGGGRTNTDRFPLRIRAGASYVLLEGRLQLSGEIESRTTQRDLRQREIVLTTGGPQTRLTEEQRQVHGFRGRIGARYRALDILSFRAGLDRIGVDDATGLRPSAGFGLQQTIGNLDLRIGYAIVLEPYVRDAMNLATLEIYL